MVEQVQQAKYPSAIAGHRAGSDSPDTFDFYENIGGGMPSPGEVPRTQVTGEISSTPTAEVSLESTSSQIFAARFTVNAGDDVVAGARLTNKQPDCGIVFVGDSIVVNSDTAITRLDVVGVGAAADTATGVIAHDESTESNTRTAMNTFAFDSSDNVKTVVISLSPTWNSGAEAQLRVEGYSHA